MSEDAWQGMLFGSTASADSDPGPDRVGARLRICALNAYSPTPARAQRIADWLMTTHSDVVVLTEMQATDGSRQLMACLEAEGFAVHRGPGWTDSRYCVVVATRGFDIKVVEPLGFSSRVVALDIQTASHVVRLVGVYAPTNGMTAESSVKRREFQDRLLKYIAAIRWNAMCVSGDLNVVEPDHEPRLPAFEPHDYEFYRGLIDFGLWDAYRHANPSGRDHSWLSSRFGNQRIDHTFVSPAAGKIESCYYDQIPRTEGLSDHAAMITTVDLG